jgi:hypothetical protein
MGGGIIRSFPPPHQVVEVSEAAPVSAMGADVEDGEKHIRGSGGSLDPPGPLPMHLHTVHNLWSTLEYSERLPTLLNPLAERTCFSQVEDRLIAMESKLDSILTMLARL